MNIMDEYNTNSANYETHSFSVELATKIGLEDAIILSYFFHWCRANADNEDMYKDGNIWVYISRRRMCDTYKYLTENKIRGAIKRLTDDGYIIISNYNKMKLDKTNWYALTDKAYQLFNTSLDKITMRWLNSPTKSFNNQAIQVIKQSYKDKVNTKEDTNVSKKSASINEDWKSDYQAYLKLVEEAKDRLLSDIKERKLIEKVYPDIDYNKTVDKVVLGYWGTEEGWEYSKKHKKGKTMNMYSTIKKCMYQKWNVIYNSKYSKGNNTSKSDNTSNEVIQLPDGTWMQGKYRYYFSKKHGRAVSIALDAEDMPQGCDCEFDILSMEWIIFED